MKIRLILIAISAVFLQAVSGQVVTNDGLWSTGYNVSGALGDGTTDNNQYFTNTPELVVPTNVTAIAAGGYHSLYIKTDGSLWAMGDNEDGELGDGSTTQKQLSPEMILPSNVTAIAAGLYYSVFLKNDGSMWAMGDDSDGELGDGHGTSTNKPEMIEPSGVSAISANLYHTLFIMTNGSLWAVGRQYDGQLGDGVDVNGDFTNKPEMIVPSNVVAIAAGGDHSLFLMTNGTLWAMGYNGYGELGDGLGGFTNVGGTAVFTNRPEMITNGVMAIAAGEYHSLFIMTNGSLWAMGYNYYGQLGDHTTNDQYLPEMIVPTNVVAIACGDDHSLFIKSDGSLWAMGADHYGQLGDEMSGGGATFGTNAPEMIVPGNVEAISGGQEFTLFIAQGSAPAGSFSISVASGALTNGQTNVVNLGTALEGASGPIAVFDVTNSGSVVLDFGNVMVGSGFTVVTNLPGTLSPGSDASFAVQLDTGTPGLITNIITISNSVGGGSSFSVPVEGTVEPVFAISVSASPYNGGVASGAGTNAPNTTNTVTATADSGFQFVDWTIGGTEVSTSADYAFTLVSNVALVANFLPLYTISVSASPANGGTVGGGGRNVSGSTNTITATANSGYQFIDLTRVGSEIPIQTNIFTFTLGGDETFVAHFAPIYTVTANSSPADGGTVSGGGMYTAGSSPMLMAANASNFVFVGWTGDATGTNNPLTITVNTNLNVTANFASNSTGLSVTVTTTGSGTVTPDLNGRVLREGAHDTLTATGTDGNVFSNWTGSITTNKNPLPIIVKTNLVLQANFVPDPYPAFKGIYNGLFTNTNGVVTEATAGMLKNLTVTDRGSYTGAVLISGGSHTVSGKFDLGGLATNLIKRETGAGGNLTVLMNLRLHNGIPEATGTVSNSAWMSSLVALLASNTLPSADYTMLLLPDTNSLPPTNSPGGDGYALIACKSGTAKITGALADGTSLGQTVPVSQDGYVPIYTSIYSGKGLLLGWINLDLTATNAFEYTGLTWICPTRTTGLTDYRGGFTNTLLTNQILLSQWTNHPAGLGSLATLSILAAIDDTNALTNIPVTTTVGTTTATVSGHLVTGTINLKTGALKVTYGGEADRITGYGAILLNDLTNSGGYFLTRTNGEAIQLAP